MIEHMASRLHQLPSASFSDRNERGGNSISQGVRSPTFDSVNRASLKQREKRKGSGCVALPG